MAATPEEKEVLREESKRQKAILAVSELEGVKIIVADARASALSAIEILSSRFAELREMELRSTCSILRANLEIYQKITGAKSQVEAIEHMMTET